MWLAYKNNHGVMVFAERLFETYIFSPLYFMSLDICSLFLGI